MDTDRGGVGRRTLRLAAAAGVLVGAGLAWAPAAHAAGTDTGGCGTNVAGSALSGYTASAEGLGAQVGFAVPNILPFAGNLLEDDVSFTRISAESGPQITSQAAPWYPGDIAANIGSLLSEFGISSVPNDPLQALAADPPSPSEPADSTFPSVGGQGLPAGLPLNIASANAHAGPDKAQNGAVDAYASSTLASLLAGGTLGSPALSVGSIGTTNSVLPGASCVTTTATSTVGSLAVAGLVDIAGISSVATAKSDGANGEPSASLHVGQVTVKGMTAYIDDTGVHVLTSNPPSEGLTAQQVQTLVDNTLAQDGIAIRLLDPTTTINGADGHADSGGLVVTLSHAIDIPYIPGEPSIDIPDLGKQSLPAGVYQAVTTLTLASAVADSAGAQESSFNAGSTSTTFDFSTLGGSSLASLGSGGFTTVGTPSGPGTGSTPTSGSILPKLLHFPIRGVPAPLGWVIFAIILCAVFSYPMLLAARWQFLSGRR